MSADAVWPWTVLKLPGPSDRKAIRRAYAVQLKALNQEIEQDTFQRLREAYEAALNANAQQTLSDQLAPPVLTPQPVQRTSKAPPDERAPSLDLVNEDAKQLEFGDFEDHNCNSNVAAIMGELSRHDEPLKSGRIANIATDAALIDPEVYDAVSNALSVHLINLYDNDRRMPALDKEEIEIVEASFRWRTDPNSLPQDVQYALLAARSSFLLGIAMDKGLSFLSNVTRIMFTSRMLLGWFMLCLILWGGQGLRAAFDVFAELPPEMTTIRWLVTLLPIIVPLTALALSVLVMLLCVLLTPLEIIWYVIWVFFGCKFSQRRSVWPAGDMNE